MKKHELPSLSPAVSLIDTHCHLDMESYKEDLEEILLFSQNSGITKIISIGISVQSSQAAIDLADKYPMIKATVGVHPHDVENLSDEDYYQLEKLVIDNRESVVGYGEIGLDYAKLYAPVEIQKTHFVKQLHLAQKLHLPIIIHCRDAQDDILRLVKEHCKLPVNGVIHCFSGDTTFAQEVLDLGFYISVPGIVTFKNALDLQKVAQMVPANRLLVETDGPFLAPTPYRGKRNHPAYTLYTAQKIAELRSVDLDTIAEQTTQNAERLFSLS